MTSFLKAFILTTAVCMSFHGCVALVPFIESDYPGQSGCACRSRAVQTAVLPVLQEQTLEPSPPETPRPVKTRRVKHVSAADSARVRFNSLLAQLADPNAARRTNAATDLGFMGPGAAAAVPVLVQAVKKDESKWVRRAAVKALPKISSDARVIGALRHALADVNVWVAHSAAGALRKIGSPEAIKALGDFRAEKSARTEPTA